MKIKNTMKMVALSAVASMLLVGCGGSDDATQVAGVSASTGTFVDAPVQGLKFKTPTQNGVTNADGQFKYMDGEDVEFTLGNLLLGKGKGGALVTPYTISPTDDANKTATNIALLLQNFDGNRTNTGVIDLSLLADANLSDVNLSAVTADMETKITELFTDPRFSDAKFSFNSGISLLNANDVKNKMDTFIEDNSVKYDKKFTQAYLDETVFYKTSAEYPQYKNKYVGGYIYFAGDDSNGNTYDVEFSEGAQESTYTLEDGKIIANFSDAQGVTMQITEINEDYIVVTSRLGSETRVEKWYTNKAVAIEAAAEAEIANAIASRKALISQAVGKSGPIDGGPTVGFSATSFIVDGYGSFPYTVTEDGYIEVSGIGQGGSNEYHAILSVDSDYVYGCLGNTLEYVQNCDSANYRISYK